MITNRLLILCFRHLFRSIYFFFFQSSPRTAESAHLYEGKPFLIFEKAESPADTSEIPKLTTWETLQKREFKLTLSHPPENIFQEMILWTEQGKLWKFPIDNEQGINAIIIKATLFLFDI